MPAKNLTKREAAARIISMYQAWKNEQLVPTRLLFECALVLAEAEMAKPKEGDNHEQR